MKTNKILAMTMAAAMAFSAASSLIAYADDPVTNSIVITKEDTMRSLDLTTLMSDADKKNMEAGNNVTVKYVLSFIGSDINNTQFVDLIGAKAPSEVSVIGNGTDATRYVRTKLNNNWTQLDMIGAAQASFSGSSDIPDGENYLQKLNLAGKFKQDENTYSYETELKIDFNANTVTEKTTKLFDYSSYADNSGKEFAFTIGSDVSKSDLTLVAYNNYYNTGTNIAYKISDISVEVDSTEAPVTAPTTEPTSEPVTDSVEKPDGAVDKVYDFRANDNEYINATNSSNADPRGSSDGNAYDLNGDGTVVFSSDCYQSQTSHGVVVWGGDNKIKIKAAGPMSITLGGCAYAAATTVTLKKADGTQIVTKDYTKECWQGTTTDTNIITLNYTDDEAADLIVAFDGYVYLPMMEIKNNEAVSEVETTATAEQISASENLAGAKAASYMASFNGFTGKLNTLAWTIEKADKTATKSVPEVELGGTIISDPTDIVVGLIITTNEDLSTIGTVTATLK